MQLLTTDGNMNSSRDKMSNSIQNPASIANTRIVNNLEVHLKKDTLNFVKNKENLNKMIYYVKSKLMSSNSDERLISIKKSDLTKLIQLIQLDSKQEEMNASSLKVKKHVKAYYGKPNSFGASPTMLNRNSSLHNFFPLISLDDSSTRLVNQNYLTIKINKDLLVLFVCFSLICLIALVSLNYMSRCFRSDTPVYIRHFS